MKNLVDMLGLDLSFFVQFAIFISVFVFLKTHFFRPFLKLFQEREMRTTQDRLAAESLQKETTRLHQEVKVALSEAREEVRRKRDQAQAEAQQQESSLIQSTRQKIREGAKVIQAEAEKEAHQAVKKLEGDLHKLSESVCNRLISAGPSA